jgi:hypothetical protein
VLSQDGGALRILNLLDGLVFSSRLLARRLLSVGSATLRLKGKCRVTLQTADRRLDGRASLNRRIAGAARDRRWYAVFAVPQNEQSVVRHLDKRGI